MWVVDYMHITIVYWGGANTLETLICPKFNKLSKIC
jgi:hypothetical protein